MRGIIGGFYRETCGDESHQPPEQMGMLMSAGSASSPLTRDVMGREGLETQLEVVERLGS